MPRSHRGPSTNPVSREPTAFEPPTYTISYSKDHTLGWDPQVGTRELAVDLSYHSPLGLNLEDKMKLVTRRFLKEEERKSKGAQKATRGVSRESLNKKESLERLRTERPSEREASRDPGASTKTKNKTSSRTNCPRKLRHIPGHSNKRPSRISTSEYREKSTGPITQNVARPPSKSTFTTNSTATLKQSLDIILSSNNAAQQDLQILS